MSAPAFHYRTGAPAESDPQPAIAAAPIDLFAAWSIAVAERDRARATAVRLEQENAEMAAVLESVRALVGGE